MVQPRAQQCAEVRLCVTLALSGDLARPRRVGRRALDGRSYGGRRVTAVVLGDEGGAEAAEAEEAVEAPAAAEPTGGRRKRRWEPAKAAPPDEPSSEVG